MTTVSEEQLADLLAVEYELSVSTVEPLAAGYDADARSFLVVGRDDQRYLLRLRRGAAPEGVLCALAGMAASGKPSLSSVVAPVPSRSGKLALPVGPHSVSLYPYLDGANAMETGLSSDQWVELGAFVRALHDYEPAPDVRPLLPVDSFVPAWAQTVRRLDAWALGDPDFGPGTAEAGLVRVWRQRRETITGLLAEGERVGPMVRDQDPRLVLCHADIHTANVLVPTAGRLRVVDWDGMLYAPPERDLMFVPDEQDEPFYRGYGSYTPGALVIAYYRVEWAIQEIGDYGRRVIPPPGEVHEARFRDEALEEFVRLFDPDHEVEWAHRALADAGRSGLQ